VNRTRAEKRIKIVETAAELAEQGGFEAVRLRDVAANAGVALGTLYKRFSSKEDLLLATMEAEVEKLEIRLAQRPVAGDGLSERVLVFFTLATGRLFRKPNLARAVLRALTSGDPELTAKIARFHDRMTDLITTSMRGTGGKNELSTLPEPSQQLLARILQQVWFAALVGWMGRLHSRASVIDQIKLSMDILLRGILAQPER
jgi:AcrR family transcriptional regulator